MVKIDETRGTLYLISQICDLIEADGFASRKLMLGQAVKEGTAPAFGRALTEARDRSLAGQPLPVADHDVASSLNRATAFVTVLLELDSGPVRFVMFVGEGTNLTARLEFGGWMAVTMWQDFPLLDKDSIRSANSGVLEVSFDSSEEARGYAWSSEGRRARLTETDWAYSTSDGNPQDDVESLLREVIATVRQPLKYKLSLAKRKEDPR
ncbi:hypothetical protein [Frigoribacterium sp. UYMn621]|uniref:hypothetical protein n=1 Tax=Frigoribacterium sp. UYMn621 TaxID=3156343 RepID=UPI00339AF6A5